MKQEDFIATMDAAIVRARSDFPAMQINRKVLIAQAALETGWGKSGLFTNYRNIFGTKAGKTWGGETAVMDTTEVYGGKTVQTSATWRVYANLADAVRDYSHIIMNRSWFKDALPHADPPHGDGNTDAFIKAIMPEPGQPGWATDPKYGEKLKSIIRKIT